MLSGPHYRMLHPTINRGGGTNNNGNTKYKVTNNHVRITNTTYGCSRCLGAYWEPTGAIGYWPLRPKGRYIIIIESGNQSDPRICTVIIESIGCMVLTHDASVSAFCLTILPASVSQRRHPPSSHLL